MFSLITAKLQKYFIPILFLMILMITAEEINKTFLKKKSNLEKMY